MIYNCLLILMFLSAGGVGVMFHIDNIANQLRKVNSTAEVRGIADSGWFIETGNVPAEQGNFRNWQVNRKPPS